MALFVGLRKAACRECTLQLLLYQAVSTRDMSWRKLPSFQTCEGKLEEAKMKGHDACTQHRSIAQPAAEFLPGTELAEIFCRALRPLRSFDLAALVHYSILQFEAT